MEIVRLQDAGAAPRLGGAPPIASVVAYAAEILRTDGVILYPTDTLYGLGTDAFSDEAVAKVYGIKERDERKPIHCIVADLEMAAAYAEVNDAARSLVREFLPGALTLVLKKRVGVVSGIGKGTGTIGIRIPANDFCLALARAFGAPFTTTSANRADAPNCRTIDAILAQLGGSAERIDLVVDAGKLPERKPSTVVDVSGKEVAILREGAIPAIDVRRILKNTAV